MAECEHDWGAWEPTSAEWARSFSADPWKRVCRLCGGVVLNDGEPQVDEAARRAVEEADRRLELIRMGPRRN